MPSYLDTVRADGSYDLRAIMQIAVANARQEIAGYARIGRPLSFQKALSITLKMVWQSAHSIRASVTASLETVSPTERRARRLEQQAEIAEGAIPARLHDALELRLRAAELRKPKFMEAAE